MNRKELIELGESLVVKGRTPTEIYKSLASNSKNKEDVNAVLDIVFMTNSKKIERSPERINKLLKANRIKLNNIYSLQSLYRVALINLIIALIVLALSNKEVNQNEIFGFFTLIQGVSVLVLFYFVKSKELYSLLMVALVIYCSIWFVELVVWGIPNDLLKVYYVKDLYVPSNFKLQTRTGGAKFIGFIFPFLYILMKVVIGWFIFVAFLNHKKFNELSEDIKIELNHF